MTVLYRIAQNQASNLFRNNRPFNMKSADLFRIATNGTIAEHWDVVDSLNLELKRLYKEKILEEANTYTYTINRNGWFRRNFSLTGLYYNIRSEL